MRITLESPQNKQSPRKQVVTSHGDESIYWSVTKFDPSTIDQVDFDLFQQINAYWETFPEETQKTIFQIFARIRAAFDEIPDRAALTHVVRENITALMSYHDLNKMREWLRFSRHINIPDCLDGEYQPNQDQPSTRAGTYLRSDYVDLVTLSMALRMMIPIWGEFIERTKDEAGNIFKEYYSYRLLMDTEIYHCVAVNKLRAYIDANTSNETSMAAIVAGVSSENYPIWVLAMVLVRRVCVGDIRGLDTTTPKLVAYIYKFITDKTRKTNGADASFQNTVKEKPYETSSSQSDDSSSSRFEGYRIREDIPIGDKVYLEMVASNVHLLVSKICPEMDIAKLDTALQTSAQLSNVVLSEAQVVLARWVFRDAISPRAYVYFGKQTIVRLLAGTQCILAEWGFPQLGAIATGVPTNILSTTIGPSDVKRFQAEIEALYPFRKRATRGAKGKIVNHAVEGIDLLYKKMKANDWLITADEEYLRRYKDEIPNKRLCVGPVIESKLTQLVVERISQEKSSLI